MILALFGFSLAQVGDAGWMPGSKLQAGLRVGGWAAGLSGAGCLAALIALRRYRGQIRSRLEDALSFLPEAPLTKVRAFIHAFDEGMQSTRDPYSVWMLVIWTMVRMGISRGSLRNHRPRLPGRAPSFTEVMTMMGFVTFAGVVQLPGVGGGMQIAALLVLTEMYGIPIETASGLALMLWVMCFLVAVPVGLLLAFREGIQWRTMRHVSEENADKLL